MLIGSAVDQAVEWLDKYADQSVADITAADAAQAEDDETNPSVEPAALKPGELAQSLVCNDCGKKFRSQAQAELHATKTEHVNFAESTEEIAPLTEEEKKAKLEELKRKAAERRAGTSAQDKLEQKRNEVSASNSIPLQHSHHHWAWGQPSTSLYRGLRHVGSAPIRPVKALFRKLPLDFDQYHLYQCNINTGDPSEEHQRDARH